MRKELNIEIGSRIKQKREERGYTREQFAELIGKSPRFVANYELGDSGVSLETLKAISTTLGTSTDYLLFGYPERDFSEVTEQLMQMDDNHYEYLVAIVRAYAKTYARKNYKKKEDD